MRRWAYLLGLQGKQFVVDVNTLRRCFEITLQYEGFEKALCFSIQACISKSRTWLC
jgi:hypothetical protein